jgi:hypothetical protein
VCVAYLPRRAPHAAGLQRRQQLDNGQATSPHVAWTFNRPA